MALRAEKLTLADVRGAVNKHVVGKYGAVNRN